MSKNTIDTVRDHGYTQNRELSWLRFNRRVLEEAADETVPLLERLKFISIFTSNLDEFFMIRVGSLFDLAEISPEDHDNKSGMTPREQLKSIYHAVAPLIELKNRLYTSLTTQLEQKGICEVSMETLSQEEQVYTQRYFQTNVLPVLSPQIVDAHHPFPHLTNKALYIALLLKNKKDRLSLGFVPLPSSLPGFLFLPGSPARYLRMETLLLHWAPSLFEHYKTADSCILCVTRNGDLSFDMDKFEDSTEEDFRNQSHPKFAQSMVNQTQHQ